MLKYTKINIGGKFMKLFFISDIHGSEEDLQFVLNKFEAEKADYLIILGDLLYHGPRNPLPTTYNPKEVAILLNRYKNKIISVRGNCDSEVDQMLLEFPIMADFSQILLDGHRFFLTHGHIYNQNLLPPLGKNDILCHGHTHIPVADKFEDTVIFNPGSITFPKENNDKSYGIYENSCLRVINFKGETLKKYNF